ncbi:MAG: 3-hydroxyacyl-ACP dehydratase FabZ [Tissierellia bacterium]|nr:3-hydroxyacyl-ACP dehydratase FabZ [Tissierellia bacterium]
MLNSNEIQQIIPHRYPMLLVDKIVELEVGKRAVGLKGVTANEPFFQGHFPDYHVMPGVLIIEALAQVGAVALLSEEKFKGKIALFAGIKNAKFRRQVIPGDTLRLECELTRIKGPIGIGIATAYVEDEVAATAELTFAIK